MVPMVVAWPCCTFFDGNGETHLKYEGAKVPRWVTQADLDRLTADGAIVACTPEEYAAAPRVNNTTSGPDDIGTVSGVITTSVEHQDDTPTPITATAWMGRR